MTKGEPMIESYKAIASHIAMITGRNISPKTCRKWRSRQAKDNPLPVERLFGRVLISVASLERWVECERNRLAIGALGGNAGHAEAT